jgi:uncharacterized protein (TIGR02145 family)
MKNLLVLFFISFIALSGFAQAPQKFSYQTVIRNVSNQLLIGQTVGIKISILEGSANGSAVFAEIHAPQTNANGLATLEIGGGTLLSGNFANINWANGPFFVKTETDPNGGNSYTISSTQQLLSVPYTLYAEKAPDQQQLAVSLTSDTLFLQNGGFVIIPGISTANIPKSSHTCGATNVHNPVKTYSTMTDQQGNTYKTIVIGNQEWMAENLKTRIYRNGELIANVTDNTEWINLTTGAWCFYNNDSQNECPYGKMYNWYAVSDPRNLCPIGWHVPSLDEWETIRIFLGGNIAGDKMKSTSSQYWLNTLTIATNESGFSGLPGGIRNDPSYPFYNFRYDGYWWSSTANGGAAFDLGLSSSFSMLYQFSNSKDKGFSVRCLKD